MKRYQRGHVEVEYGDLKPGVKVGIGITICALGLVFIGLSVGWSAAIGVGLAMWGYRLQMEGQDELDADGVKGGGNG